MSPNVALLVGVVFIFCVFRYQRSRAIVSSTALFWPTLWYLVVASRPVGVWFELWGFPVLGGDSAGGSVTEQVFYGGLTVVGVKILLRRRFDWGATRRANPWLAAFLAFMAISILWSDFPFISFKRYIKIIGSIVMALVVLTDQRPFESILTVIRRCLYIHLPMSIICMKYFREIGVSWDWGGAAEYWQGISTSKNTLGQVAMLGVVYFFWEIHRHWPQYKWRNLHVLYLLMALYLLKGSEHSISLTSASVTVFALITFWGIASQRLRPAAVRRFVLMTFSATVGLITLVLVHSVVMFSEDSLFGRLITMFGRDITLTDRTVIWADVYAAAAGNPLLGVGYGGFWIDRIANIPWNANMTWVLGQGHSGFVDTYLQLGFVGCFLLAGVLFTTLRRMLASLAEDFDFGCFRITLFVTILFVNITESTYLRGDHHLWFIMMLVVLTVPSAPQLVIKNQTMMKRNWSQPRQLADNVPDRVLP